MKPKILRKVYAVLLLLSLFVGFTVECISAEGEQAISARSAALYEPETKSFLYSKNADARLPMASTTKIMTALVAIERENLDKEIVIDERAVGVEGSSAYLKAGEVFTLRELLYALMLQSANDAAEAIAYALAGGIEPFADMMNEKAESLGLTDTHFKNPHGLDDLEHYTTARELAIIAAAALEFPEFSEIVSTKAKKVEKSSISRLFVNHNKLLSRYDGCIGVKTGFTKKCGRCLVSAAERDGLRLICVTLDAPSDWSDHTKLLDLGFSSLERRTLFSAESFEHSIPLLNAESTELRLGIEKDVSLITKAGDSDITCEIQLPPFVSAPIKAGTKIGKIAVFKDGEIISTHDLLAKESVSAKKKKGLFGLFQ